MARPDAVRRVKSYSAANGFVYQYFGLRILVRQSALETWARSNGRALTSSEEYAVAKMRLFQAFDEGAVPPGLQAGAPMTFFVDDSNLEPLLQSLNI